MKTLTEPELCGVFSENVKSPTAILSHHTYCCTTDALRARAAGAGSAFGRTTSVGDAVQVVSMLGTLCE